jgi:hypothetical protein
MKNPFRILRFLVRVKRPSRIADMPVSYDDFWIGKGFSALTFFGTIVAASTKDAAAMEREGSSLKRHEMIHLRQAQATGDSWLLFYLLYGWYYLRALRQNRHMHNAAYYINPFELEAYQNEDDQHYLEQCNEKGATQWRNYAKMSPEERMKRFFPHF